MIMWGSCCVPHPIYSCTSIQRLFCAYTLYTYMYTHVHCTPEASIASFNHYSVGMLSTGFGHVVNVSSIAGKISTYCRSSYCAAKFGLNGMMDALRHEVHCRTYVVMYM